MGLKIDHFLNEVWHVPLRCVFSSVSASSSFISSRRSSVEFSMAAGERRNTTKLDTNVQLVDEREAAAASKDHQSISGLHKDGRHVSTSSRPVMSGAQPSVMMLQTLVISSIIIKRTTHLICQHGGERSCAAAGHQGAVQMFWLHFRGARLSVR